MGSLSLAARSAVARLLPATVLAAASLIAAVAILSSPVLAAGPHLKLVETKLDPTSKQFPVVSDGVIELIDSEYGNYQGHYTWTPPPTEMDGSGGSVTLNVSASAKAGGGLATGMGMSSTGFNFDNNVSQTKGIWAHAGASKSESATIHFTPSPYLTTGEFVELKVGVFYYGGATYRYQVVGTDDGYTNASSSQDDNSSSSQPSNLAVGLDCPPELTIGAPPLNCHLVISGFRHNTADAVSVRLPAAADGFGNHNNGVQVFNTEGEQDVFNMNDPYSWGFFVIACPTDSHVGGNCYDFKATGGTTGTVPFEVCQKNSGCVTFAANWTIVGKAGGPTPPATAANHYIGNRWAAGGFLNIENGSPGTGWIKLDWLSARWSFEAVPNTTYYRIRNAWHGDYLNVEHGQLEVGPIEPSWQSAMWQFFPAPDNAGYQLIGNVWKPELFITAQPSISVVAAPVDHNSQYAHWWVLD